MPELGEHDQTQLEDRLFNGFGALLKEVDELKRHCEAMKRLLGDGAKVSHVSTKSDRAAQDFAVSDGIKAYEALKRRKNKISHDKEPVGVEFRCMDSTVPPGHPSIAQNGSGKMSCPFARDANRDPFEQMCSFEPPSPLSHRQTCPPTPPDTGEQDVLDTAAQPSQTSSTDPQPAPISVTGSLPKCPIRLLDERPPEEIAEYFETHKHEIPRSHEVCVKRYQSNEQSIRQLDAKYGSLVNMIKGLGMKHQPLLPHQDEGEEVKAEQVDESIEKRAKGSITKVDDWVGGVRQAPPKDSDDEVIKSEALSEREGHFDRPLKEIRVGESPSRPWGISVPPAAVPRIEHDMPDHGRPESKPLSSKEQHPNPQVRALEDIGSDLARDSSSNLIFKGPVFIGYPPEQAAKFLENFSKRK